jgi:hypothetical protein
MTERRVHNLEAQITSKMHELITCMCVVNFRQEGDRRGIIEQIESLTLGKDFAESFERSQFKVHLTSGDVVIVSGSAISTIESTAAGSDSTRTTKKLGREVRKARPKTMTESIAIKPSKAAAKARTRRAKERTAQARSAKVKQKKAK